RNKPRLKKLHSIYIYICSLSHYFFQIETGVNHEKNHIKKCCLCDLGHKRRKSMSCKFVPEIIDQFKQSVQIHKSNKNEKQQKTIHAVYNSSYEPEFILYSVQKR